MKTWIDTVELHDFKAKENTLFLNLAEKLSTKEKKNQTPPHQKIAGSNEPTSVEF